MSPITTKLLSCQGPPGQQPKTTTHHHWNIKHQLWPPCKDLCMNGPWKPPRLSQSSNWWEKYLQEFIPALYHAASTPAYCKYLKKHNKVPMIHWFILQSSLESFHPNNQWCLVLLINDKLPLSTSKSTQPFDHLSVPLASTNLKMGGTSWSASRKNEPISSWNSRAP